MKDKFEFSFKCDENPMKMEESSILNGDKKIDTRHCTKCERNIVDFTKFTPQQITEYLKNNKKPCGFIFPWQEDQVNEYIKQNSIKSSPFLKIAKIAAVVGSPLLFNPAVAQRSKQATEISTTINGENKIVTEVYLKDIKQQPIDSVEIEVYVDNKLVSTMKTDIHGKITLDHADFDPETKLVLKNVGIGIEKSVVLKSFSSCVIWDVKFEIEVFQPVTKFDLEFIYLDKNDKPIRFTKVDVELYDTTNTLIETVKINTNISGHSYFKTSNIAKTQYISFTLYTKDGRRTAYKTIRELNKKEMNIISVNKKFRQHLAGLMMM